MHKTRDTLDAYLYNWPVLAGKLGIALAVITLSFYLLNWLVKRVNEDGSKERVNSCEEMISNPAYLLWRTAGMVGLGIALFPAMGEPDGNVWIDLAWTAGEGIFAAVIMLAVIPVVDRIVLGGVNNLQAVLSGNKAIALTDAGFFLAIGVLVNGALDGTAPTVAQGVAGTLVFLALGLAVTIGVYWLHELVTPHSLRESVRQGHSMTAAYELAGLMLAVAIVVREGVAGDFDGWGSAFAGFTATVIIAIVTLYGVRWLVDFVLLPGRTVRSIQANDETGASAFLAAALITSALIMAHAVRAIL